MQVMDLVRFLEAEYQSLVVWRASIEDHDSGDRCSAHVELFVYAHDEVKVRRELTTMDYSGRDIRVSFARQAPREGSDTEKNPLLFYVKNKEVATNEEVRRAADAGTIQPAKENNSLDS